MLGVVVSTVIPGVVCFVCLVRVFVSFSGCFGIWLFVCVRLVMRLV